LTKNRKYIAPLAAECYNEIGAKAWHFERRNDMGLLKAGMGAAGGFLADQWRDYFYCDALAADVLVHQGKKRANKRSSNTKGTENVISNGSIVAVADGQCMLLVDQGKVTELCAEPGEFLYDSSTEPSIFFGKLGKNIGASFRQIGKRFAFGGEPPKDQRVYFVNTKEIPGNKYGTVNPVPFRVVDRNIGLDIDIAIRCNGEYSYRITDPIRFYTNVCGNVKGDYQRENIDSMLKTELLTALQPAFARISELGIRYSALPGHTQELTDYLNEVLSKKWGELRGMQVWSFGVNTVSASKEDEDLIKQLQRGAVMRDPNMAGAQLTAAQADAMRAAAANTAAGPAMAFMGMNMAGNAGGMHAQNLFAMGQPQGGYSPQGGYPQQPPPQPAAAATWVCACGAVNVGKFCAGCGKPAPAPATSWTCACGATNSGKFCANCGAPAPAAHWTCTCGAVNTGKFCNECGKPRP
jgi:membrane protease subunit (stomatin/prohibitin family)